MDSETEPILSEEHYTNEDYREEECPIKINDRGYLSYLVFYLLGIGSLLPWNFFSNAQEYFKYKLRNATFTNVSTYDIPEYQLSRQVNFENYITIAAMIPNVLFLFLNTAASNWICVRKRIIFSLSVMIAMFIVTVCITKIDTDSKQNLFFIVTIATIILMNAGSAVFQGAIFGLASTFPKQYPQAVMAGMGMGGTIAATCNIVSISMGDSPVVSAFYFFLAALSVLMFTMAGYLSMTHNRFSRYHLQSRLSRVNINESLVPSHHLNLYQVFKKMKLQVFCVFITYLATLTCYPAITGSIKSMNSNSPNATDWQKIYYTMFSFFLLFNVFDLIGRTLVGIVKWPGERQKKTLLWLCVLRLALIPFFLLCNAQPRQNWLPVLVSNDWLPPVVTCFYAFSNGYLGTLACLYGPVQVDKNYKEMAGSMMTFFLSIGLAAGSLFSLILKIIYLEN